MKCYRDLRITSRLLNEEEIIRLIELFARSTPGWTFPEEKSREYLALCGLPSCCLIHEPNALPKAVVHFTQHTTKKKPNGLYVPNIVPLDSSSLSISEYNEIALKVARELRSRAMRESAKIRITLTKSTINLQDLIGGKVAQKLFQRYISLFPESNHPNDIARLDAFTCSISRYSRRRFDVDAFEYLLCEELGWSREMAWRCRIRVEIGLDIMAASRELR